MELVFDRLFLGFRRGSLILLRNRRCSVTIIFGDLTLVTNIGEIEGSAAEEAQLAPLLRLEVGAFAGIIAMSATNPVERLRGRLSFQVFLSKGLKFYSNFGLFGFAFECIIKGGQGYLIELFALIVNSYPVAETFSLISFAEECGWWVGQMLLHVLLVMRRAKHLLSLPA
ncbi:hypothetical protein L6164_028312 [Bauhinia variegata]|uniref:Uncharacterized protein n=1 Tax=Bauhinia variegata TaxID=167791 RepID=A0ACB9LXB0_BAUVA|nr:hypothetical protein L6164_028312 [Bauhinia variegata]